MSRLGEIVAVLAKYGWEDIIESSGIGRWLPKYKKHLAPPATLSKHRAENLRAALQELGPTFIKLGQFLSTRPDLLPIEYIEQLEKLQDQVPPFPSETAVAIIENEFKASLGDIFSFFNPKPKASASLAQTHFAYLKNDIGPLPVAVKIQRPFIKEQIEQDMQILFRIAHLLNRYSSLATTFNFVSFVEEFNETIHRELDFTKEAQNLNIIAKNLKHFDHLHIPKVYWEYSTSHILTLERINGQRLTPELVAKAKINRRHLAEELLEAYLKQIIEDGFFHADPHLGNLLLEPDGRLALFDLGIVGTLDNDLKFQMGQLLLSFANQEADRVTNITLRISAPTKPFNIKLLEQDIRHLTAKYQTALAYELGIGKAIIDLAKIAINHNLLLPPAYNLLAKTLFYLDLIMSYIYPKLDYLEFIRRSTQRIFFNLWQNEFNVYRLTETVLEANKLNLEAPSRLNIILNKLSKDDLTIKFEHEHLEGLIKALHQIANRLTIAIIITAIILGSSLIMQLGIGAPLLGYPSFAVIGFIFAALLGIYLIVRIFRSERM